MGFRFIPRVGGESRSYAVSSAATALFGLVVNLAFLSAASLPSTSTCPGTHRYPAVDLLVWELVEVDDSLGCGLSGPVPLRWIRCRMACASVDITILDISRLFHTAYGAKC